MNSAEHPPRWYTRYPDIYADECRRLTARGYVQQLGRLAAGQVVFCGESHSEPGRQLIITFPSGYPSYHPCITDDGAKPPLSRHHHPVTREICLFGPGARRWSSADNCDSALDEAEDIIAKYPAAAVVDKNTEVPEPLSAVLPVEHFGGFLVPRAIAGIIADPPSQLVRGTCELLISEASKGRGVVRSLQLGDQFYTERSDLLNIREKANPVQALLAVLPSTPPSLSASNQLKIWLELVGGIEKRKGARWEWIVFVYPEESRNANSTRLAWTVARVTPVSSALFRTFVVSQNDRWVRVPGREKLIDRKVVIVGLGAIGSRIAVELARTGVQQFTLVDGEVYEPANAVRHECGIGYFGLPKVQAVSHRILELDPSTTISGIMSRVGLADGDCEKHIWQAIREADLVINATANQMATHWLDEACHDLGRPRLHVSITGGAWAGEVIRVLPGGTCWRCHQEAVPEPPLENKFTYLFAPGCAQPTFTGSMPELSVTSEIAATIAVETLLIATGASFPSSYVAWHWREKETGRWQPEVHMMSPTPRVDCPLCTARP